MRVPVETQHRMSAASASSSHDPSTLDDYSDKQHRCDMCSKRFSRASILRDHIRRHEKEKPFQCGTCDKAFASKSDQKRHENVHVGRKFSCDRCGKEFTRRLAITKHVCPQAQVRNAANHNVAQSFDIDPSNQYPLPSNSQPPTSEGPSVSPVNEIHTADARPTRLTHTSARRDGPFPSPPSSRPATEDYRSCSGGEEDDFTFSDASSIDFDPSDVSEISDQTDSEQLPDWEEYDFHCGICPAQYESNAPLARHLVHHLEELDLRPYRCNDCMISFAFQEELAKHEKYDQREQREGPNLSLACIWNCGKVFTSADACRAHIGNASDTRCILIGALEMHLRTAVLQQFKELLAPEAEESLQTMQKLIDSSLSVYKPRSLDMGWFHRMIAELHDEQ